MQNRDEGIETIFAAYADMTEEKKQKFTQVTSAITSGLPSMSDCFNHRLDGANQLAVAKWTVSMSYLIHEIIRQFLLAKDPDRKIEESDYQRILSGKDDLYQDLLVDVFVFVADLLDHCTDSEDVLWYSSQFLVQKYNQFRKAHPTDKHACQLDETVFD